VKTLSEDERRAVELRFVEERPLKDVGAALARDGEAARLFLFRLRQRLADCVRRRLALGEAT
jgi:DNA-directed RNA polymerase specialized sigma24 family protein